MGLQRVGHDLAIEQQQHLGRREVIVKEIHCQYSQPHTRSRCTQGEWARGSLDDAGLRHAPGIRRHRLQRASPGYALAAPDLGVSSASKSRGGHTASLWALLLPATVCRSKRSLWRGLPWWSVIKNPPWNEGNAGLIPGWGPKRPHAMEKLSLHPTTTEPVGHN